MIKPSVCDRQAPEQAGDQGPTGGKPPGFRRAGMRHICYNLPMFPTPELVDQSFLEMRWRCLSLAADLDRLERAGSADPRREKLLAAIAILLDREPDRAQRVQLLFSDP